MILADDLVTFLESGVSITLASCSSALIPSVARARGCRVIRDDKPKLRILVPATEAAQLLDDVRSTRAVSATFSHIGSHKTLQFKSRNASVDLLNPDDSRTIDLYERNFGESIFGIGFSRTVIRGFFAIAAEDFLAIEFAPEDLFQQTPGPNAGSRIATQS